MERTKINELKENVGKKVLIKGWVHEIRDQSKIKFILFRDNSGIVQLVIPVSNKDFFDKVKDITRESVLSVEGVVKNAEVKNPEVTEKTIEVNVEKFEVLSLAETNLPLQVVTGKDIAELSTRLDYRWIDLRKPKNLLIFKIWTAVEAAMREYWINRGFIEIHSPKLINTASESGAEVFEVKYFDRKAYLAQSPQFYKQMAMAAGFEKIFEIGPVFRAEKSHTTRHLTEITMVDSEISFIKDLEDIMKYEEEWIVYILKKVKEQYGQQIKDFYGVELIIPTTPFPKIKLTDALNLVYKEKGYKSTSEDLDSEAEKLLGEIIKEKYNHEFVFVTEYPVSVRPFYHMYTQDGKHTQSYDLLWKGLEITTGAVREHRYEILKEQAIKKGLNPEGDIKHYLNFFRYGCPPHGGFGFGFGRFVMNILGLKNVKEVIYLPRDIERLTP